MLGAGLCGESVDVSYEVFLKLNEFQQIFTAY